MRYFGEGMGWDVGWAFLIREARCAGATAGVATGTGLRDTRLRRVDARRGGSAGQCLEGMAGGQYDGVDSGRGPSGLAVLSRPRRTGKDVR